MEKVNVKIENGEAVIEVDSNADGQPVAKIALNLTEAIGEAMARSEPVEGVKLVNFSFEGAVLKLQLDTDQDGEKLLELSLDLSEAVDEVQSAIAARKAE